MDVENKGVRNFEIEQARARGETYVTIARRYGLSPSRVRDIIANRARTRQKLEQRIKAPLRHTT